MILSGSKLLRSAWCAAIATEWRIEVTGTGRPKTGDCCASASKALKSARPSRQWTSTPAPFALNKLTASLPAEPGDCRTKSM